MPMDEVIDKYNFKRILGEPGKAVDRKEYNTWTLPDDAQVDTPNGIKSVPGGSVIVEIEQGQFIPYSITEFNELFILAEVKEPKEPSEPEPSDISITN